MLNYYTTKGKHLTITEHRFIQRCKEIGKSNREIALLLDKAPQTINNEIKRGLVIQQVKKGKFRKIYSADKAQSAYDSNRTACVKPIKLTKELKRQISYYMNKKYSPEMMVKSGKVNAAVSSIYYWIHNGKLGLSSKHMLYPRKGKSIKRTVSPNFTPCGKSIETRPSFINKRLETGHYEIDTVILTRAKNSCLLTLTDRKSRYQIIRLIPEKTSLSVNNALKDILKNTEIKSITADNGREFNRLSEVFDSANIYYAHPYSSWERGTNENHNRLIRRWLPKGTQNATQRQVALIEDWINYYPKKILGYKSPRQFLMGG